MTDLLAELRVLEKAATPGPWRKRSEMTLAIVGSVAKVTDGRSFVADLQSEHAGLDGDLVVLARNVLPALLDVAEAAQHLVNHPSAAKYRLQPAQLRSLRAALAKLTEADHD